MVAYLWCPCVLAKNTGNTPDAGGTAGYTVVAILALQYYSGLSRATRLHRHCTGNKHY